MPSEGTGSSRSDCVHRPPHNLLVTSGAVKSTVQEWTFDRYWGRTHCHSRPAKSPSSGQSRSSRAPVRCGPAVSCSQACPRRSRLRLNRHSRSRTGLLLGRATYGASQRPGRAGGASSLCCGNKFRHCSATESAIPNANNCGTASGLSRTRRTHRAQLRSSSVARPPLARSV